MSRNSCSKVIATHHAIGNRKVNHLKNLSAAGLNEEKKSGCMEVNESWSFYKPGWSRRSRSDQEEKRGGGERTSSARYHQRPLRREN